MGLSGGPGGTIGNTFTCSILGNIKSIMFKQAFFFILMFKKFIIYLMVIYQFQVDIYGTFGLKSETAFTICSCDKDSNIFLY